MPQMQITGVGLGLHVCWVIPLKASMKIQAASEYIMGQGNTKWYKQCALRIKWRVEGKTHLMELNYVLPVVYESTYAPGTGTWLFTTFAYGKSSKYERILWGGWAAGPQGSKDDQLPVFCGWCRGVRSGIATCTAQGGRSLSIARIGVFGRPRVCEDRG